MAATKYSYTISTDFPNGKVAPDRLTDEIQQSVIVTALDRIDIAEDTCDIWFKGTLTAGDQTILDGVVADHAGEPLAPPVTDVKIEDARFDADKKQVVVLTPAPRSTFTWYTSRGDTKVPLARGDGQKALVEIPGGTDEADHVVKLSFAEDGGVYIHDGEVSWRNMTTANTLGFGGNDEMSIYLEFPATEDVVVNPGGTGNCNLYSYGPGNVIVPAGGAGGHDVDLATAVPLPDSSGYWVIDKKSGELTPYTGQDSTQYSMRSSLMDFAGPDFYLVCRVGMTRSQGVFEINAYLVEWASKWWNLCMKIEKHVPHTDDVEIGAWLMLFRWNATVS